MQTILKYSFQITTIVLVLSISILSTETFAQNNLKIFDVPGGSGGSSSQTDEGSDNTAIYVIGGLVIAGLLAYALVFKKDKKSESDTTASLNSNQLYSGVNSHNSVGEDIQKVKDEMPLDIFLGIKNNEALLNERTYQLGLRIKL